GRWRRGAGVGGAGSRRHDRGLSPGAARRVTAGRALCARSARAGLPPTACRLPSSLDSSVETPRAAAVLSALTPLARGCRPRRADFPRRSLLRRSTPQSRRHGQQPCSLRSLRSRGAAAHGVPTSLVARSYVARLLSPDATGSSPLLMARVSR